jgi:beta-1,4-mannosyltransferase
MLRKDSVFQKIAYWYERTMAPLADGHLCVTKAMKDFLIDHFGVVREISVLYDCPPGMFRPLTIEEQHEAMLRIQADLRCPWTKELTDKETFLTEERRKGEIVYRKGRPALITSSTSWTEDEDFGILLDALVELDHKLDNLRVLVLVTGKGPMKEMFEEKISKLRLENVFIDTLWLAPRDYPKLLACADVGISLHGSTSGKDLPMKVLDLFGCETPVCALHFDCISELLQDNVNGRVFYTSEELVERLHELLMPLQGNQAAPHSLGALSAFSENIKGQKRWRENWMEHAMPLLTS